MRREAPLARRATFLARLTSVGVTRAGPSGETKKVGTMRPARMLAVVVVALGLALAFAEPMDARSELAPPQEAAALHEAASG